MRIGYGVRVKRVKAHDYVDVWRYETRSGRRIQVFEYVGPLRDPATEGRVAALLEEAHSRAMEGFRRRARAVASVA